MPKITGLSGVDAATPPAVLDIVPSAQQQAIFDSVGLRPTNLIVEARAGTGKTTTLIQLCKLLGSGIVYLAFNKAISLEVGQKLAAAGLDWKQAKSATMHSVGFQAWVRHAPRSGRNVRGEKLDILAEKLGMPRQYRGFCKRLVSLAKQTLIGVPLGEETIEIDDSTAWLHLIDHHDLIMEIPQTDEEIDEETYVEHALAWSLRLLRESIEQAHEVIDFDDMIYMPLYASLRLWQYKWVFIDEAQDTNIARRVLARRLLAPGGHLIAVGDRFQSIYGFTGADADALDLIERDFGCAVLPLTVTWRCPRRVVELANQWVPDLEAHPDAAEGTIGSLELEAFKKIVPAPTDAILCRNMRPLVQVAFDYLKRHIPCYIEGRDIGESLVTLCKKWKSATTLLELDIRLTEYLDRERERLLPQHKLAQYGALEDKVQTLRVILSSLGFDQPPEAAIALLRRMFQDDDGSRKRVITLSTIHKSKGREWGKVFLLGRQTLIPSPFAKQEWQLQQERNLAYVAVTRVQDTLVDVILPAK